MDLLRLYGIAMAISFPILLVETCYIKRHYPAARMQAARRLWNNHSLGSFFLLLLGIIITPLVVAFYLFACVMLSLFWWLSVPTITAAAWQSRKEKHRRVQRNHPTDTAPLDRVEQSGRSTVDLI